MCSVLDELSCRGRTKCEEDRASFHTGKFIKGVLFPRTGCNDDYFVSLSIALEKSLPSGIKTPFMKALLLAYATRSN